MRPEGVSHGGALGDEAQEAEGPKENRAVTPGRGSWASSCVQSALRRRGTGPTVVRKGPLAMRMIGGG